MKSEEIFTTALEFEKKIRDLYLSAEATVDDERGKAIFRSLAGDEQSHVDFLEISLDLLEKGGKVNADLLTTSIPDIKNIRGKVEKMQTKIPERMLGDIKSVLSSALKMENETTDFYRDAMAKSKGEIRRVMEKFVEIEQRHSEVVRMELDHASHNGHWFDFMELSMEEGWYE